MTVSSGRSPRDTAPTTSLRSTSSASASEHARSVDLALAIAALAHCHHRDHGARSFETLGTLLAAVANDSPNMAVVPSELFSASV
jgi:hypothetical protein